MTEQEYSYNPSDDSIISYVSRLVQDKLDFTTIDHGSTHDVIFPDGRKETRRCQILSPQYKGFSRKIYNDAKKRMEKGIYKPFNQDSERSSITTVQFCPENMRKTISNEDKFVQAIDISACYTTTAYHLGLISEKVYKAMVENPHMADKDYKTAMSAGIGLLGMTKIERRYKNGRVVEVLIHRRPTNTGRLDVIDTVWKLAQTIIRATEGGFIMFLTDCFYVMPAYMPKITALLDKLGYMYKSERIELVGLTHVQKETRLVYQLEYLKESNINRDTPTSKIYFSSQNCWRLRD